MSRLGPRYHQALGDAATWHATQLRKATDIPYVSHLLAVSATVMEDGGTEDECIAALLHDAVEDAGVSVGLLRERYGDGVARIVAACTDDDGQPGGDGNKAPWWERKVAHISHVAQLGRADISVVRVTAADKLSNLRSTLDEVGSRAGSGVRLMDAGTLGVFDRFKTGLGGFVWYQQTFGGVLVDTLGLGSLLGYRLQRALDELDAVVDRYRTAYGTVLLTAQQQVSALAPPPSTPGHTPWAWFALDAVHRARGARPRPDEVVAAWAGWFDQPLPGDPGARASRVAELLALPQVRALCNAMC